MTDIDWCSGLVQPGPKITKMESIAKKLHPNVPISTNILNCKFLFRSSLQTIWPKIGTQSDMIHKIRPRCIFFLHQTLVLSVRYVPGSRSLQASSFLWLWSPPKKCLFQVVVVTFLHCVQLGHINLMKLFLVIAL